MLPLDIPDGDARRALEAHGADPDGLYAAFEADMDESGRYVKTWLALDADGGKLYRLSADKFDTFALTDIKSVYMEGFLSSSRLMAVVAGCGSADKTVVLCVCGNARMDRMSAFLSLYDRLACGVRAEPDDAIFSNLNTVCPKCGRPYLDRDTRVCVYCMDKKGMLGRIFSYFRPFRREFATVMICLVLTSLLSVLSPIFSGQVLFDQVVSAPTFAADGTQLTGRFHHIEYVYIFSGILILLGLLSVLVSIVQNRANAHISQWVGHNMRMELFSSLQRHSYAYFNKNSAGGMFSRVNYDTDIVKSFYIDGVPYLLMNVINFVGITAFMLVLNYRLTLIIFIPMIILFFYFKHFLPELYRRQGHCWRGRHAMNVMLGDTINGMRVVKAFAREADETSRFGRITRAVRVTDNRYSFTSLLIGPVAFTVIGLTSQAIWGVGGVEVMQQHMTYGQLTAYVGYTGLMFGPLTFFSTFALMLTDTLNCASRIFDTLDSRPEVTQAADAADPEHFSGGITFDSVCFHYDNNKPVLRNVSFDIKPGDRVGIVGHTGGGKSTIVNLITRMYDVTGGAVRIDGRDVRELSFDSLRRNVAVVSQEIYVFCGTIADNIRFGRPEATFDEVVAAARAANAHDFIMRLPDGYETYVGEGNISLSGGERQRISIARALLADPTMLIFDEATAAMDTRTEKLIGDAMSVLTRGKTTIMIAHRLSTLKDCDYIMAIENGEVAEIGTAEQLLAQRGVYYRLYTLQNEQLRKVMQGS